MDHGLMMGMLIGGIVLSAFPIALGVAIGVRAYRYYREWRAAEIAGRSS
jgi:hypothetical protein